ncbi:MAG: hypothetical protein EA368_04180 [Leptolyngbya sp. DLM2.Bin27]|nr:MAG: hypothetical protein EA368_04180 [Leptolyngbya sp. DLM2.Bin27]
MLETISLALATPIAAVVLNKFYEGLGSKLGGEVVTLAAAPIKKLGQLVWDRLLKGKPDTDKLLEQAAKGEPKAQERLQEYLSKALENSELATEVEPLARELQQVLVQIDASGARNVQTVTGGQGLQVNDPKSQVIQAGENARFYFGAQPND